MPRTNRPPNYRLHKASKQAVVTIHGRDHYLGLHGTPESHAEYVRCIAQWHLDGPQTPARIVRTEPGNQLTVNELVLRFLEHAQVYYRKHGRVTGEFSNIKYAVSVVAEVFGRTPAANFDCHSLELVREAMIDRGWKRTHINRQVSRVRRMIRWAATKDHVPANNYHALLALDGLKRGRSRAVESEPVKPVDSEIVSRTCNELGRHVRTMVQVQELAGMRPQDILNLRSCDIDMSADIWVYRPHEHKLEHFDLDRLIAIGPRGQALLTPLLKPDAPTSYVFSPREAVAEFRAEARRRRKTPLSPSQRARKPKSNPRRGPGDVDGS